MAASVQRASADALARLAKFGACDVSDALVKLKVAHGGLIPDVTMYSPNLAKQDGVKIIGEAYTVKMVLADDTSAPKLSHHFADEAPRESIFVISAPPHLKNACWGGLMTARAQSLGVKAAVLDGRCRDLAEHREAGFPVFARGHSTLGQATFIRASEVQVPLTIVARPTGDGPAFPSVEVLPYSVIIADVDGVVVIPVDQVEAVIALATKLTEADRKVTADLRQGVSVGEAFKRHR